MITRIKWLACLLGAAFLLTPATARAQIVGNPDPEWPLPLMWNYKDAGWFVAGEAVFMRLDNPIRTQIIAVRGFFDIAGDLSGRGETVQVFLGDPPTELLTNVFDRLGIPGQFVGSKIAALDAVSVGSDKWEPGFRIHIGYRFRNDIVVQFTYMRLADFKHSAGAGVNPHYRMGFLPGIGPGGDDPFADTFISAPFFNIPPEFAGAARDVVSNVALWPRLAGQANVFVNTGPGTPREVFITAQELADLRAFGGIPLPAYGIWNAAESMVIELKQKVWSGEITMRFPVTQTECTRCTFLAGPRIMEFHEQFSFFTVDLTIDNLAEPENAAWYTNTWINQLYGVQIGSATETYLGGGFACGLEGRVGLSLNYRRTGVEIERGDADSIRRDKNTTSLSPWFQVGAYLWWYPIEGVQFRAGYDFLGVFNTRRSEQPISFDLGKLDPTYVDQFIRLDGFNLGVAFIF